MKTAEEIVRALAGADAPTKETVASGERCALCGGALVWGFPQPDVLHAPDCPYRMAREWVEAKEKAAAMDGQIVIRVDPNWTPAEMARAYPDVFEEVDGGVRMKRGDIRLVNEGDGTDR